MSLNWPPPPSYFAAQLSFFRGLRTTTNSRHAAIKGSALLLDHSRLLDLQLLSGPLFQQPIDKCLCARLHTAIGGQPHHHEEWALERHQGARRSRSARTTHSGRLNLRLAYDINLGLVFECQVSAVDISYSIMCPIFFSGSIGPLVRVCCICEPDAVCDLSRFTQREWRRLLLGNIQSDYRIHD